MLAWLLGLMHCWYPQPDAMLCQPHPQQAAQKCLRDALQQVHAVPLETQQAEDGAADTLRLDACSNGMQDRMAHSCCAMPAETAGRPPQSKKSLRSTGQASREAHEQSSSLQVFTCAFCKESLGMALKLLRSQHEHDPCWFC